MSTESEQVPDQAPRPGPRREPGERGGGFLRQAQATLGNAGVNQALQDPGDTGAEVRRGLGLMNRPPPETEVQRRQRQDDTVLTAITDALGEYQGVDLNVPVNQAVKKGEEPQVTNVPVEMKVPYRINGAGGREYGVGQGNYPTLPKGDDEAEKLAMERAKLGKANAGQYETAVQEVVDKQLAGLQAGKGWLGPDGQITEVGRRGVQEALQGQLQYTDRNGTQSQALGVDCSGFVYDIIRRVQRQNGFSNGMWNDNGGIQNVGTATMLGDSKNFKPVPDSKDFRPGDLVLEKGHVEMVMGNNTMTRDEASRYGLPADALQPYTPPRKKGAKGPAPEPIQPEVRLVTVAESHPGQANYDKRTRDRYGPDVDEYIVVKRGDGTTQWYRQRGEDKKSPGARVWTEANRSVRRVNFGWREGQ